MRGTLIPAAALLCLVVCGPAATSFGQVPGDTAAPIPADIAPELWLSITTDPPGATVFLDSSNAGTSPLTVRLAEAGAPGAGAMVSIRIVGGEPDGWFAPVVRDSLRVAPERTGKSTDTVARHYVLPAAARIVSDPAGAEVHRGDSVLGRTPLFVSGPEGTALVLRAPGFGPATVVLHRSVRGMGGVREIHEKLRPHTPEAVLETSPLAPGSGRSNTLLYVAGGTAVAGGAVAAWLKNRADRAYEDYRFGNDPATLDRVRRYDLFSGISLAVAELSIGYLLIELLSR